MYRFSQQYINYSFIHQSIFFHYLKNINFFICIVRVTTDLENREKSEKLKLAMENREKSRKGKCKSLKF